MTASVAPGVDVPAGARDLVATVKEGKTFDAALEAAGLIPILGKIGDASKLTDTAKTYVKAFPAKAADAQRVVSDVMLRHAPDGINPAVYRALGADEAVTRLRADGLSDADLEELTSRLKKGESLSDVMWATKYGDELIYLVEERFKHIIKRHSTGVANPGTRTDFFPTGRAIKATDDREFHVTPYRMSEDEIPNLIDEVVENPIRVEDAWSGDTIAFTARVEKYGIETMEVRARPPGDPMAGRVATAWPKNGMAVWRFDGEYWVRRVE